MTDDRSRAPTISKRAASPAVSATGDQDYALLQRMADGDESALAALYDRWSQRVHTMALCMLKDSDDAEDVVEETFWQVWRTASRFDPTRASISTWVLMIARSRTLDRLRAQRRRAERTAEAAASILIDHEGCRNPAALLPEVADSSRRLAEALDALPEEQREALELAYLGGLSHAEIAAQTAQPLGTVKTRIRLAMDKLRQKLFVVRGQV